MRTALTILSLMTITLSPVAHGESTSAEPVSQLMALSNSLPQNLNLTSKLTVPEFCRVNAFRDQEEQVEENDRHWVDTNMWLGALAPSLEKRQWMLDTFTPDHKSLAVKARSLTKAETAQCQSEIAKLAAKPMQQSEEANATALQAAYFCKDVTLLHLNTCASLVPVLLQTMKPVGDINLINLWLEFLSKSVYAKVLAKVLDKNLRLVAHKTAPKTRFFEDLKTGFLRELKDREQATDATFTVLAILSTDGNNTSAYMPCEVPPSTGLEQLISITGIMNSVLDRLTAQKGFLYTYPAEADVTCDYGKTYHFWMAAYLAREGTKQTHDPVGAAAAAFTLNKGYQFLKEGGGRNRSNAFTQNVFSNYNNNMRLDLAQAAAGAWFGATSLNGQGASISQKEFESGLRANFSGAKETPRVAEFKFPTAKDPALLIPVYARWRETVNPDAAFKYFQKSLGQ
jgi:hypothetical protein